MKKLESKKFVMSLLVFGLLSTLIILSYIISTSSNIVAKVSGYVSMAQSIGLVLAGGLVTYFIGQSYVDGRREYKQVVKPMEEKDDREL